MCKTNFPGHKVLGRHCSGIPPMATGLVYLQKSDFHLINKFCVVIVVKNCIMASPGSLLVFSTA